MAEAVEEVRTLDDLHQYVQHVLCRRENLAENQFPLMVYRLLRKGRECGLRFLLTGPRQVRVSAIWAADKNRLYFYDARGERFEVIELLHRLQFISEAAYAGRARIL